MTASTWTWIGGSSSATIAANWTLTPGGTIGVPAIGDTEIVTTGTVVEPVNAQLKGNTIEIGGTAGGTAEIDFVGKRNLAFDNPTVNNKSLITSAVSGVTGPVAAVLDAAGTFINQGSIVAHGTVGSTFTINVHQTTIGTATLPGYFINYGEVIADKGNKMTINVGGTSALLNVGLLEANGGKLVISGDPTGIAHGYAPVVGIAEIKNSGIIEANYAYPADVSGAVPTFFFADGVAGDILQIDKVRQFSGRITGFEAGDTIDLGVIPSVGSIAYDGTTGVLELESNTGSIIASLVLTTGSYAPGTFPVTGTIADGFTLTTAGGHTLLTTSVQNITSTNSAGTWQAAATWNGGVAPGIQDTPVIGQGATSAFIITTGTTAVTTNSLTEVSKFAALQITSSTTVGPAGVQQIDGTIEVTGGNTLTTPSLRQLDTSTLLQLDVGSLLDITGHPNVGFADQGTIAIANSNTSGLQITGSLDVNGGTLNAGPTQPIGGATGGEIAIGYDDGATPASVTAENGAAVADTYVLLGSDPTSFGSLSLTGSSTQWTDAGDPNDLETTRGFSVIGFNNVTGNDLSGVAAGLFAGTAQLSIQNGATMTEASRAYIAVSNNGVGTIAASNNVSGAVSVTTGGLWDVGFTNGGTGGFLDVGFDGAGSLDVTNGGTVEVGNVTTIVTAGTTITGGGIAIAHNAGSSGTISVGGGTLSPSMLISNDGIGVGLGGHAVLDVLSGGTVQVSNNNIAVGASAGVAGTISVSGTNAVLATTAAGGIGVGLAGTGTLDVLNGGSVSLTGGAITVGVSAGSSGSVDVAGSLGTSSVIDLTTNGFDVGESGQGTFEVDAGGTVSIEAHGIGVGVTAGSKGLLDITGAGALVTLVGTATTGVGIGQDGTGSLTVQNSGLLNIGNQQLAIGGTGSGQGLGSGSVSVLTGGTIGVAGNLFVWQGSKITVDGTSDVGIGGVGTLQTGAIVVGATAVAQGDGVIDAAIVNNGRVIASNTGTIANSTGGTLEVTGSITGTGTLLLASGSTLKLDIKPSAGQTVFFNDGTPETLILVHPGSKLPNSLRNLGTGDRIEFANNFTITAVNMLNGGTAELTFNQGTSAAQTYDLTDFKFAPGAFMFDPVPGHDAVTGNDFITAIACFAAGTRISTASGELAVESLAPGDQVQVVLGDGFQPVTWIGHRRVDCLHHPKPADVWPVRISADAFGAGLPRRDLFLSPDHAVYVGDVLIPVKFLINGTSITQVMVDQVTYYHVELPKHDVLLADGLPAESYLDAGDRSNFANAGGPIALYPDFSSRIWEARGCAPLVVAGPELEAARQCVRPLTQAGGAVRRRRRA